MQENDIDKSQQVFSPLRMDADGRFSRKGKAPKKQKKDFLFFDRILVPVLFMFFLLSADFIVFAGSGNLQIFENSILPIRPVLICLAIIFVICSILTYLLQKIKFLLNIGLSIFIFLVVIILFNQFEQIHQHLQIDVMSFPVSILSATISAVIVFIFLNKRNKITNWVMLLIPGILFLQVYWSYYKSSARPDYTEVFNNQQAQIDNGEEDKDILIYFMLPNLISPSYMVSFNNTDLNNLSALMKSFLQKYNFKLYRQAYLPENEPAANMIRQFNPLSRKNSSNYVLPSRLVWGKWSFYNLTDEDIFMNSNELYDYLHANNYQISAYKSKKIDFCYRNNEPNVERCVDKINKPITFHNIFISNTDGAYILFIEWLKSMRFFKVLSPITEFLNSLSSSKGSILYRYYDDLHVLNVLESFDIIYDDIKKDGNKQAYIVLLNLPSNMYIYDEFCQIKPMEQWLGLNSSASTESTIKAYSQQTQCLLGKLEDLLQKLQTDGLWNKTTLILQGISGVQGFGLKSYHDSQEEFIHNRLVTMALHFPKAEEFSYNDAFCSTSDILADELWSKDNCVSNGADYHERFIQNVSHKITSYINKEKAVSKDLFDSWYENILHQGNETFNYEDYLPVQDFINIGIEDITPNDVSINKNEQIDGK